MSRLIKIPFSLALFILLIMQTPTFSQITISADDILGLIGQQQTFEQDASGNTTVDLGTASDEHQTWDFSFNISNSISLQVEYLSPVGSVFETDFPDANLLRGIIDNNVEGFDKVKTCSYFEIDLDATTFSSLGVGAVTTNPDFSFVHTLFNETVSLPLHYNQVWATSRSSTLVVNPDTTLQITAIANQHVDAYGTMQLPSLNLECLRVRSNEEQTTHTVVDEDTIAISTATFINYSWVTENNFVVATVGSQENETDPNFEVASNFQRLFSFVVSVDEPLVETPSDFTLFQNYPNPFNPETVINYYVPRTGRVELTVFNVLGQKIRTLVDEVKPAGTYDIKWKGLDDLGRQMSSGVYFYRLKSGNFTQTNKMVLLQ